MAAALARAWAWAKEHKAVVAIAAALVAAFFAGRYTARQPSVHEVATEHGTADASSKLDTKTETQSEKITITDFDPGRYHVGTPVDSLGFVPPNEAKPGVVRQTVIERGPTTTESHAQAQEHGETDRKLDLTITPSGTGWAIQAGIEDVLGARPIRLELRRRLFAGAWVGLAAIPSRRELGVSLSLEF